MRFNVIGVVLQSDAAVLDRQTRAVRLWLVVKALAFGWQAAELRPIFGRPCHRPDCAFAVPIVASLPWSYRLITNPEAALRAVAGGFRSYPAGYGVGFLVLGVLFWLWPKRWWATHHLHACAVIANRVIFSRTHGPKIAVLSILVHVLTAVIAWCVVRSIEAPVSYSGQTFQLVPPVMLITMAPISIAGWGVREATMGLAFGYAGLVSNEGVNISLVFGAGEFPAVGAFGAAGVDSLQS